MLSVHRGIFAVLVFSSLPVAISGKCLVGQRCFPSASELAAFNTSIGGRLFAERPIGAVCYAKDKAFNEEECYNELPNFFDDLWISDHFPAYQQTNWGACGQADSCYTPNPLNATATCGQGRVPNYAVYATTSEHIVAYMKFAVKHNLRVVVKNTGHDYAGRSSGQGGFALWTHLMNSTARNARFVPKSCRIAPQDSVKLGAGVLWGQAYAFAETQNITLVGGAPQVGAAGGWVLGGGHSYLSASFGLGVDNLLEMDIITPDSRLQTISECSNPELFWAVRGGGGATFGIIVSVTYKAYPAMSFGVASFGVIGNRTLGLNDTRKITTALAAVAPSLGDLGVGGLFSPSSAFAWFVLPSGDETSIAKATAPFWDGVKDIMAPTGLATYPSFHDFAVHFEPSNTPSGIFEGLSSRLIPRSYFTPEQVPKLVDAILAGQQILTDAGTYGSFGVLLVPPAKQGTHNAPHTSINPVWYDSLWHVVYGGSWEFAGAISKAASPLRALTPDSGAYQNEADVYEPDHRKSFWGEKNYARLAAIKKQVDPGNVLQVWHGVGFKEHSSLWHCYKIF